MSRSLSARIILAASAVALCATSAIAAPECTKEPKEKWLTEADMTSKVDALGYKDYKKILVSGNCYEIYGKNKDGKKVEVYFNPVDGTVVEEEVD